MEFEQGGISIVSNQLSSLVSQMVLDGINGSNAKDSKRTVGSSPVTFLNSLCFLEMPITDAYLRVKTSAEECEGAWRNETLRAELFPLHAVIPSIQLEAVGIQAVGCDCKLSIRRVL